MLQQPQQQQIYIQGKVDVNCQYVESIVIKVRSWRLQVFLLEVQGEKSPLSHPSEDLTKGPACCRAILDNVRSTSISLASPLDTVVWPAFD